MRLNNDELATLGGNNRGDFMRSCIGKLKERYPHLSSAQIAQKVGIGKSTINRIENGTANPGLNSLMKILSFMGANGKVSEVLKMASDVEQTKEEISHNADSIVLGDITKYLNNPDYKGVLLIIMASSKGSTREEIKHEHGARGIRFLSELVDLKVVTESPEGVLKVHSRYYDGESVYATDQRTNKNSLLYCLKAKYDSEQFGTGNNWLSFQTDSINKTKAMKLIRSELKKAYINIDKIIRSNEFRGDDKIFIGLVTDSLTDNLTNKETDR